MKDIIKASSLIFRTNELLLMGEVDEAEKVYHELISLYRKLPPHLKSGIYNSAMMLRKKIMDKQSPFSVSVGEDKYLRLSDGSIIRNLYHLVYTLEYTDNKFFLQNIHEFGNWIEFTLMEKELALLIRGITDKKDLKLIIQRYILLKEFDRSDYYI